MVVNRKGNPRLFQGNLGEGEISFHLARNHSFPWESFTHRQKKPPRVEKTEEKSSALVSFLWFLAVATLLEVQLKGWR